MEEKNEIEVISKIKEKKQYDSFIYSLPFKTGAVISSLLLIILGIVCVLVFVWLWEGGIYKMTDAELNQFISQYEIINSSGTMSMVNFIINLRFAVVPIGVILGILYLIDMVFIFAFTGHKRGSSEITKFPTADWPFDVVCILYLLIFTISFNISDAGRDDRWFVSLGMVMFVTFLVIISDEFYCKY